MNQTQVVQSLSNTACFGGIVFTHNEDKFGRLQRDSAQVNPFPKFLTSEQAIHSPYKKQQQKNCKGSQILIVLVVSFQQKHPSTVCLSTKSQFRTILGNINHPITLYITKWLGFLCFVYCETGLSFFLPARNQKLIISTT